MSRSSTYGCLTEAETTAQNSAGTCSRELLEGVVHVQGRSRRPAAARRHADPGPGAPAGERVAVCVPHLEVLGALDVESEPLRPTPDPEMLEPLALGAVPLPEQDTLEADLAAGPEAHLDDDVVKAGNASVLDLDVAFERSTDGSRQVAAGELLRSLVERLIVLGNVDGLVRHVCIVSPRAAMCIASMRTSIRIVLRTRQGACWRTRSARGSRLRR